MSRYQPDQLNVLDYENAADPALALEFRVLASTQQVQRIAEFSTPAANSGVLEMSPVGIAVLAAGAADLQMAVVDQLRSDQAPIITLNVTDVDNGSTTAVANFTPPAWVQNDSFDYQPGYAVDLVTANGKKVKAIIGIASVVGGKRGSRLRILALPERSTFERVGYCTNRDFSTKSRVAEPIPEDGDGSKVVKRGRSEPGELKISQKFGTFGDGLSRLSGRRVTVMLELYKDDVVLTDRMVFANYIGAVKPTAGEGNDHAVSVMEGLYQDLAVFVAK